MTIKAINVRNQFKGAIKEIVLGDVLSEIDVQIAFVKSTEVSIAKL
jgi:molybdopterin-binding protein